MGIFGMIGVLLVFVIGFLMFITLNLTMTSFIVLFILFWVFGIIFIIGDDAAKKEKTKEVTDKINKQLGNNRRVSNNNVSAPNKKAASNPNNGANFLPSMTYTTPSRNHAIKIDRNNKKISILINRFPHSRDFNHYGQYDYKERLMGFKNVLETRIVENGATVTKTSRTSQIGGAALGGLLAGNVGAMIGGLSGKKTSENEVSNLELIIIVNSFNDPIIKIPFFDVRSSVKKTDKVYRTALNDIQKWNAILGTLIQTADNDDIKTQQQTNTNASSNSLSDEINKLVELKNNNHITDEEFKAYKEKLLK